jgi:hypothetical protein
MKKAAMTPDMLVRFFLVLIGFGVVLFIFFQIDWIGQVDDQVCKESVIIRGTLQEASGILEAGGYVPLKCKTSKICLREDKLINKGKCIEQFQNVKPVEYIDIDSKSQKIDVEKVISNEVIDCWKMMGEGKISLFSKGLANYGIGGVYPTCVICSRIAFDKELNVNANDLDIVEYMRTHKISQGNVSYYDYIIGTSPAAVSGLDKATIAKISNDGSISNETKIVNLTKGDEYEFSNEMAVLFMQISTPTKSGALLNIGKVAGGTILAGSFVGGGLTGPAVAATGVVTICSQGPMAIVCGALALIATGFSTIKAGQNRGVTAGYCGDIAVGEESKKGCSVVRTMNYDPEEIKKYCAVIESIA